MQSDHATIRFNVGGQRYEVSSALILENAKAKSSMLAALVSERWNERKHGEDNANDSGKNQDTVIFIDRNGVHFGHMLDYLRYGSVHLPITVCKADFLRDLDYFGVLEAEDARSAHGTARIVQDHPPLFSDEAALKAVISKVVEQVLHRPRKQGPTDFVAKACADNYKETEEAKTRFHDPNGAGGGHGWDMMEQIFLPHFDEEHFNRSLAKYHLRFVKTERTWGSVYIYVKKIPTESPLNNGGSFIPIHFEAVAELS